MSESDSSPPSLSSSEVGQFLLNSNFLLTALEYHTELIESGHPDPQLLAYFANISITPPNSVSGDDVSPVPLPLELAETHPVQPRRAPVGRTSSLPPQDERIALLEYELRGAREDIERLQLQLREQAAVAAAAVEPSVGTNTDGETVDSSDADVPAPAPDSSSTTSHSRRMTAVLEMLKDPVSGPERRLLNTLIKMYLRQHQYKFSLIAFEDETIGQIDSLSNLSQYLPSPSASASSSSFSSLRSDEDPIRTGGLLYLYRTYVRKTTFALGDEEAEEERRLLIQELTSRAEVAEAEAQRWKEEAERRSVEVEVMRADAKALLLMTPNDGSGEDSSRPTLLLETGRENPDPERLSFDGGGEEDEERPSQSPPSPSPSPTTSSLPSSMPQEQQPSSSSSSSSSLTPPSPSVPPQTPLVVTRLASPDRLLHSSVIIDSLYELVPRLLKSVKKNSRENFLPLIAKLLRVDHPRKASLPYISILKNPNEEQRVTLIEGALELWGEENESENESAEIEDDLYFRNYVVGILKKSLAGDRVASIQQRLLAVEFVVAFFERRRDYQSRFFHMIDQSCDDVEVSVRLEGLRALSLLLSSRKLVPEESSSIFFIEEEGETESGVGVEEDELPEMALKVIAVFQRFLEDEEDSTVLTELFFERLSDLFDWLLAFERSGMALLLHFGSRMLTLVESSLLRSNFPNFCRSLKTLLQRLQTEIGLDQIDSMVEDKLLRCPRFRWLLENAVPRLINLIISNDLSIACSTSVLELFSSLNDLYGESFHESILKRGFVLILGNDRSERIREIRKRLTPFYFCGICTNEEIQDSLEKFVLNIALHEKPTYTNALLRRIVEDAVRLSMSEIPHNVLEVIRKLRTDHPLDESIIRVCLSGLVPPLTTSLTAEQLEGDLVGILFEMAEKPECSYELMVEILRGFGDLMVLLPPSPDGPSGRILGLFRYYIGLRNMEDPAFYVFLTALFQILVDVVARRKFVRYILEIACSFATAIPDVAPNMEEPVLLGLVRGVCRLVQVLISPPELSRQEIKLVKELAMPSVKAMRDSFPSHTEIRQITKALLKDCKRKTESAFRSAVSGLFKKKRKNRGK